MHIDQKLTAADLLPQIDHLVQLAVPKVRSVHGRWERRMGSPVITIDGKYTARYWTDWTLGFFIGQALLLYDLSGDDAMLELGCNRTFDWMNAHLSHTGVHDHGFNIISTYGNLRRLILEKKMPGHADDLRLCEMALRVSGAVQAARFQPIKEGGGYVYSFNGPHSLFADTIRSMRSLVLSHHLGHYLLSEAEQHVNLLHRALEHALTTAKFNVYFGEGRDIYDVSGRVAHESIFNVKDGSYRCPSTQQGYSPFSTWTRGAGWIILGFAELLEFLPDQDEENFAAFGGKAAVEQTFVNVLKATCDYYIEGYTMLDGIPYWDTGAPALGHPDTYRNRVSDPYQGSEPVDSSAAAITAQGLIRFGRYLSHTAGDAAGESYIAAGLTVARTLFSTPYLSTRPDHEGLILHSLYHYPRGFDQTPAGRSIPCDESSLWGDYHALELALLIQRMAKQSYMTFFAG
jgi:unsaturated chondroitin disaccharide hydrolase